MNTATYVSGFLSSIFYGYIVKSYGYDAPFLPMIVLLVISALLWLRIDPAQDVILEAGPMGETPGAFADIE